MPKRTKIADVVISISGGIIEIEKRPAGISILIKDYDLQEHTSETKKDKYGSYQPYFYQEH
jgi:hypothetical protein